MFRREAHVILIGAFLSACAPADPTNSTTCTRPDLAFAGDVLLHDLIQSDAAHRAEGFAPAFQPMRAALSRAHTTIVNLEGPTAANIAPNRREVADPGTIFDNHVYDGFPLFNYHPSIAGVLADAGVDVVQTANNHAMDRGVQGVERTLATLAGAELGTTGTRPRGGAANWHYVRSVNGRNIAFLSCTYSTNGLADSHVLVLRCYSNTPSIPNLIQSLLAQAEVDAVILLPHWGSEYSRHITARQQRLAQQAADAGAAAIVGAHPHVLQPMRVLTSRDGRAVPVAFSLGNLISSQWRLEQRTGAVLYLDLGTDANGRTIAVAPRYLPTRVERTTDLGVAVFPAAQLPTGAASLAHAQSVLGPGMVSPNGCVVN